MHRAGRILVTGASGFIGRHLVRDLIARGESVRALARKPAQAEAGVDIMFAPDLLDQAAIRSAVSGCSSVIHLAARVHARPEGKADPASECRRVNVEGTSLLLDEAAQAGVGRFVFVSSVKAVASESESQLSADTAPMPSDEYGESKLEAERLVKVAATRAGMSASILRLPVVYGPGMKGNVATLYSAIQRGIPLPLASIRNRRSLAYVGNVVEALAGLLQLAEPATRVAYVSDENDMSTPEIAKQIGAALRRPPRLVHFPPPALRATARFGGLLSRFAGLHLSSESLTALLGSLFVDTSTLRDMTGYRPTYTVEQGMSLTADWFRATRSQ